MSTADGPAAGHRSVPHTADTRLEAWAPTREGCLAEAVAALVASFADPARATPQHTVAVVFEPAADEDLLAAVLDEVIYRLEVDGELPVASEARPAPGGGVAVRFAMAPVDAMPAVGAVPKAVSLERLRFAPDDGGWRCAVTVDV